MEHSRGITLAKQIIELDLKRDELFEELAMMLGSKANDLLRAIQNHKELDDDKTA